MLFGIVIDKNISISDLIIAVLALGTLLWSVVSWLKTLERQKEANRENLRLQSKINAYNSIAKLQENALTALSPAIFSAGVFSNIINTSANVNHKQLSSYIEGLNQDFSFMEKGLLPYYMSLRSDVFFNRQLLDDHMQKIDYISARIRNIIGIDKIPLTNNASVSNILEIEKLIENLIDEAEIFIRNLGNDLLNEGVGRS